MIFKTFLPNTIFGIFKSASEYIFYAQKTNNEKSFYLIINLLIIPDHSLPQFIQFIVLEKKLFCLKCCYI